MPRNNTLTHADLIQTQKSKENAQTSDDVKEILQGLQVPKKYLSSRFFYDSTGSELFEQITHLPEYYPYKTEKELLHEIAPAILTSGNNKDIVELGSGDCSKISILFNAIDPAFLSSYNYFPIDISETALKKSAEILKRQYPALTISPVKADFMKPVDALPGNDGTRLVLFFGSTIGNLTHEQALRFFTKIKRWMSPGDQFLVGFDRMKSVDVLEKAYNDSQGITAGFNKNILTVVNQHLQSNFDEADFEHHAFFNAAELRIEMHLKAIKELQINTPFSVHPIVMKKGETIHTENSHKFTEQKIMELADKSGLQIEKVFSDKNQYFSLAQFKI